MFPENRLSSILIANAFTYPYNLTVPNKRTAYAQGGVGVGDPSQGLKVQLWTAEFKPAIEKVVLSSELSPDPVEIYSAGGITELTLAFDQNMNLTLAFTQLGSARLYWFDTLIGSYVTTVYPDAKTPRVTLDDSRQTQTQASDLILAYIRNESLYFRRQRDRFLNERLLRVDVGGTLEQMGMNVGNRLQFKLKPYKV